MFSPIVFYSPVARVTKDEEKARKRKMSIIIERYKDKVSTLPKQKSWMKNRHVYKYEGFWYNQGLWIYSHASFTVEALMALQDDFKAQPTDVFLASHQKSGTTWLKALAFAIMNRTNFIGIGSGPAHPLLSISPHDCVPFIETESFLNNPSYANGLMATHIPYTSLPKSIISSGCRVVYICRNPKDVLISLWHHLNDTKEESCAQNKLEDVFELFRRGILQGGPFWDHVIGYYKASLERPDKVLFLNYENIQQNAKNEVRKLANFIGCPFTEEEEVAGEVEKIIELCNFKNLSKVNNANMEGDEIPNFNRIFFRIGKVGDSINHLTTEMIQILDKITEEKYDGLDISV